MLTQRWTLSALFVTCLLHSALAQLKATTPGPNETYAAGSACTIAWVPDASGTWKNVSIDLMSGSNNNMSLVTNVVSGLDGTSSKMTPYNWTCPEVNPYSSIYFYQFTNGNDNSTRTWTTRFTISSPNNETIPPPNPQQPDGDSVPWGMGHLISKSAHALSSPSNGTNGTSTRYTTATSNDAAEETDSKHGHREGGSDSGSDDRRHGDGNSTSTMAYPIGSNGGMRVHTARISDALAAASRASDIVHNHTPMSDGGRTGSAGPQATSSSANGAIQSQSNREGVSNDVAGAGSGDCQCGYALESSTESVVAVVSPVIIGISFILSVIVM